MLSKNFTIRKFEFCDSSASWFIKRVVIRQNNDLGLPPSTEPQDLCLCVFVSLCCSFVLEQRVWSGSDWGHRTLKAHWLLGGGRGQISQAWMLFPNDKLECFTNNELSYLHTCVLGLCAWDVCKNDFDLFIYLLCINKLTFLEMMQAQATKNNKSVFWDIYPHFKIMRRVLRADPKILPYAIVW